MRPVYRFSEDVLFNVGFDRPSVEALRHVMSKVGNTPSTTSLPDAVTEIESFAISPPALELVAPQGDLTPAYQPGEQVAFLLTEVRQLAELVAALTTRIHDIEQGIKP